MVEKKDSSKNSVYNKASQKKHEGNVEKKQTTNKKEEEIKEDKEEQPRWYHYLIVLAVLVVIFGTVAVVFEYVSQNSAPDLNETADVNETYIYKYSKNNVTYNIELNAPQSQLEKYDFIIEPSRYDILNTLNFTFSFDTYNGSDNGQVALSAIKLRRFLDKVYFYSFNVNESFANTSQITCQNSTENEKVVLFEPRENQSGVFMEENGCMVVKSTKPNLMPFVIDQFMVDILEDE